MHTHTDTHTTHTYTHNTLTHRHNTHTSARINKHTHTQTLIARQEATTHSCVRGGGACPIGGCEAQLGAKGSWAQGKVTAAVLAERRGWAL